MTRGLAAGVVAALAAAGLLTAESAAATADPGEPVKAAEAPAGHAVAWRSVGPGGGGWIEAIACDPKDPDILYVGCDVGGFYVSYDGGRHYEVHNAGLRNPFVEVIAPCPADSRLILLGTEGGVFRSTDQGHSWQWIRAGFPEVQRYSFSAPISALCFDPTNPRVAYAGVGRPRWDKAGAPPLMYRSEDAGETWVDCDRGAFPEGAIVSCVQVKPDDGRVVLAATNKGVFRSDDGGRTWRPSNSGLANLWAQKLAFAPSAPNVVYLTVRTTARAGQDYDGGVYRSDDAGRTWQRRAEGLATQLGRADESRYMTSNAFQIVVDPRDADVAYVGDEAWVSAGVYKTTDGGRHWQRVSYHWGENKNMELGWISFWGPSVECMAISPVAPDRVFFGTSGHVYATLDGGRTWVQRYCEELPDGRFRGTGLEVTCVNDIVPDPVRRRRLYFCFADIGLLISDDLGQSFRRSFKGMKNEGNAFTVVVDPAVPRRLWAATGQWAWNAGDVCRSDDDGATWAVVGKPETGLPDGQTRYLLLDETSPVSARRLLVTVRGKGVYETRDGGDSWAAINGDLPAGAVVMPRGLLLDPADPAHILYAAGGSIARGAGVYETHDGGRTWRLLTGDLDVGDIYCLAADPRDFRILYLGARELYDREVEPPVMRPGGLFRSTDGGRTWRRVLDYHFVGVVAVGPNGVVYAGTTDHPYHDDCTAEGVLRSTDRGRTWTRENDGLTLLQLSALRAHPRDPGLLFAGTGGNGAFIGRDSTPRR